jgi:hypothetical protein
LSFADAISHLASSFAWAWAQTTFWRGLKFHHPIMRVSAAWLSLLGAAARRAGGMNAHPSEQFYTDRTVQWAHAFEITVNGHAPGFGG